MRNLNIQHVFPCFKGDQIFVLDDRTIAFDCIELLAGNWSKCHALAGLKVHPGIEREAKGASFGDLADDDTFRALAKLAYHGNIRDWHAGPPCWSFGTLRQPWLRSKNLQAMTSETPQPENRHCWQLGRLFLLTLSCLSGRFVSVEQPGSSVKFCWQRFN